MTTVPDITVDFKGLNTARNNLVFMARTAETAERYEDMCKIMKLLVQWDGGKVALNVEERNLLSVAYKNVIGTRRASHRCLSVESPGSQEEEKFIKKYKSLIETELDTICQEILDLLTNCLVPKVKETLSKTEDKAEQDKLQEAHVFYLKMTGDYYRYLAEIIQDTDYVDSASKTYKEALDIAEKALLPTHPIRLGLALNFSVCYFEILKDQQKACELAKTAFDAAIAKLDSIDEASYKDSTLIMQLLRDNLTLWTSDNAAEQATETEQTEE